MQFQNCDCQSLALRWPDSGESIQVPELNLFFCESRFGAKIVNRKFEAIRVNRSNVMNIVFFFGESILANWLRFALRIAGPSER